MDINPQQRAETLKSCFVASANQITKLYTLSLNAQSEAYQEGYQTANKDILDYLVKFQQSGRKTVSVDDVSVCYKIYIPYDF